MRSWSLRLLLATMALASCQAEFTLASGSCNQGQVQQMFNVAKYGSTGCIKLKSLVYIFGNEAGGSPKLTASRFLTANLVFTGTVIHVLKDPGVKQGTSYSVIVLVHCYLKGRLSSRQVKLSGLQASPSSGLCLDIGCQDGDTGLFFATYINSEEIRINENGFIKEGPMFDTAMRSLRCRENHNSVAFWPVDSAKAPPYCRRINAANETACGRITIDKARVYLGHVFINFESDLKPECQEGKDSVMRKIILPPVSLAPSFSRMSSYGKGTPGAAGSSWTAGTVVLMTALQLALASIPVV